ncbi:MAG: hypothetical protein K8R88_14525 [Armatimonadetes bacterium]|nr:hypothetical protein [Armatimonadota bacterium]
MGIARSPKQPPLFFIWLLSVPVAFFEVAGHFAISKPGSWAEAMTGVILISGFFSLLLAVPLALVARKTIAAGKQAALNCFWGALFGFGWAVTWVNLMLPGQTTAYDIGMWLMVIATLHALVGALVFGTFPRGRVAIPIVAVMAFASGVWFLPEAAYKALLPLSSMSWIEIVGAKRLSTLDSPVGRRARRDLANHGDKSQIPAIAIEVDKGLEEAGMGGTLYVLRPTTDPVIREKLFQGFKRRVDKISFGDSTFGEEEELLVQYAYTMADYKERRAVPLLIRTYRSNPNLINFRNAVSASLASIGGDEAGNFAVELLTLEPLIDQGTAKNFSRMKDPAVQTAYHDYLTKIKQQKLSHYAREQSVSTLLAKGDRVALGLKAEDKFNPSDRGKAIIALVRLKDPDAERLLIQNGYEVSRWSYQLRGFADITLARSLSKRILQNGRAKDDYLIRFVAGWAPPESLDAMTYVLRAFDSDDAAFALCQIGDPKGLKFVIDSVKSARQGQSRGHRIIALGLTRSPVVEEFLMSLLADRTWQDSNWNGKLMLRADIAAFALNLHGGVKARKVVEGWVYRSDTKVLQQTLNFIRHEPMSK